MGSSSCRLQTGNKISLQQKWPSGCGVGEKLGGGAKPGPRHRGTTGSQSDTRRPRERAGVGPGGFRWKTAASVSWKGYYPHVQVKDNHWAPRCTEISESPGITKTPQACASQRSREWRRTNCPRRKFLPSCTSSTCGLVRTWHCFRKGQANRSVTWTSNPHPRHRSEWLCSRRQAPTDTARTSISGDGAHNISCEEVPHLENSKWKDVTPHTVKSLPPPLLSGHRSSPQSSQRYQVLVRSQMTLITALVEKQCSKQKQNQNHCSSLWFSNFLVSIPLYTFKTEDP